MLQEHFYVIKAEDLTKICVAAHYWYAKIKKVYPSFEEEDKKCVKLRNALWEVIWDEDAKLIIDEL